MKKVLVIGDVMIDEYCIGDTKRISPEAPVPILQPKENKFVAGGASNVAANLANLAIKTDLGSIIGNDTNGFKLAKQITNANVNFKYKIIDKSIPTTHKKRLIANSQQIIRVDNEKLVSSEISEHFSQIIIKDIKEYNSILISDYEKGSLKFCQKIIQASIKENLEIFIDPKGDDFQKYMGATILTPNEKEFKIIVGEYSNVNELINKAEKLISDLNIKYLLVTRGAEGMILVGDESGPFEIKSVAKEVFDVTGAGDTVIATIVACRTKGFDWKKSILYANYAAGQSVSHSGSYIVNLVDLNFFKISDFDSARPRNISNKIITKEELIIIMDNGKKSNKKFVMTNGVFDILHVGHAKYLAQAKQLGDYLIVALNSDLSVKLLSKAPNRPINNEKDRKDLLSFLQCVDYIISFDEKTPYELYKFATPDILVKGGDYTKEEIVGSDLVENNGGEVLTLEYENGYSTTNIIKKIKGGY